MKHCWPAFLLVTTCLLAQNWESEMEARVKALVSRNGPGTDASLRQRLIVMGKQDQAVRTAAYVSGHATEAMVRQQEQTDDRLTAELKRIVAKKRWPTIRLVGLKASEDAALILTHSRDHAFQRKLLPELQHLAESGQILGSFAAMVDKLLISEGKLQRFGTQFSFENGEGKMLPAEDPQRLDQRRTQYLLPAMAEYKKLLRGMYHVRIE